MFGYSSGGLPSERLLARLGMPVSDTTVLRCVKKLGAAALDPGPLRIAGIDEWAWRKGMTFGTIVVDLERREVVAVLTDRSADSTAEWLAAHPGFGAGIDLRLYGSLPSPALVVGDEGLRTG